jgi:hypothetical protein
VISIPGSARAGRTDLLLVVLASLPVVLASLPVVSAGLPVVSAGLPAVRVGPGLPSARRPGYVVRAAWAGR